MTLLEDLYLEDVKVTKATSWELAMIHSLKKPIH